MSNWVNTIRLAEIIDLKRGFAFKSNDYKDRGHFILRVSNIVGNGIIDKTNSIFLNDKLVDLYETYQLEENDILLVMVGATTGKIGRVSKNLLPALLNQNLWNLKPKSNVDKTFLYYKSREIVDIFLNTSQGSARDFLKQKDFLEFQTNLPPLVEQIKIAKILQTVDGQIEKTEAIIAKYKAIKQGLMQELFNRGIDVTTGKLRPRYQEAPELYKNSPLGMIPKEWKSKTIGTLTVKVGSGITPTGGSEVYLNEGVLFIRSQNVLIGELTLEDAAFIDEFTNEKMAGSKVSAYDVLLNITGASIGRCTYFPPNLGEANVNQHVCIIRFKQASHELAVFASAFLNSHFGQNQIYRLNAGGNREGLNYQQIRSFSFPEIKNPELKIISTKLEAIASKIKSEEAFLQKLQQLKKGLMSDLLSGKVRVKVDEEVAC